MSPVLVIQLARLGDLLQTKRLILSLQQEHELHLCVDHSLAELAAKIYPAAVVHPVAAHKTFEGQPSKSPEAASSLSGIEGVSVSPSARDELFLQKNRQTFCKLQSLNFAAVYNLNYSGLNLALSTLFPAKIMRGHWLDQGQTQRSHWVELAFRYSGQRRLAPLNLMDFWGLLAPRPVPGNLVNPLPLPKGGGLGVVLAGRMSRRSLPPAVLAACVAAAWQRLGGPQIFLIGSALEQNAGRQLMREMPPALLNKTSNLAGKTNLLELCELIGNLDLLLTPDTGAMHLAACLGTPVEAFFLSSAWAFETGPYGVGHKVWQAFAPCLPCLESAPCPYDVKCLNIFKQKEFWQALACKDAKLPLELAQTLVSADFGLLPLEASFDELGVTCSIRQEQNLALKADLALNQNLKEEFLQRQILRELLLEYCAAKGKLPGPALGAELNLNAGSGLNPEHSYSESLSSTLTMCDLATSADLFFAERDWMLPAYD